MIAQNNDMTSPLNPFDLSRSRAEVPKGKMLWMVPPKRGPVELGTQTETE